MAQVRTSDGHNPPTPDSLCACNQFDKRRNSAGIVANRRRSGFSSGVQASIRTGQLPDWALHWMSLRQCRTQLHLGLFEFRLDRGHVRKFRLVRGCAQSLRKNT